MASASPTPTSEPSSAYVWTVSDQEWLRTTGDGVTLAAGLLALSAGGVLVLSVKR